MCPFWKQGAISLYLGDCHEVISQLDNYHTVISDPPFGITAAHWDYELDWLSLWQMFWYSLPRDGVVALHASQPFSHYLAESQVRHYKYHWIWVKNFSTAFLNAKFQPLRLHEEILIFYRQAGRYFPQKTDGHIPTNSAKGSSIGKLYHGDNIRDYVGGDTTRFPSSVLHFKAVHPCSRIHSSQKPIDLVEYLVKTYFLVGETVLDFAMGSGTTAIACINSGRRFIGIEKDLNTVNIAIERINTHFVSWYVDKKVVDG